MKKHNNNLDLLRLLFALTVFILHFVELADISELKFLFKYFSTYYAIIGFFCNQWFLNYTKFY